MLQKQSKHIILALIFFLLTLGQQYLFYYTKSIPIIPLTLGKYIGVFLFFYLLTFIKNSKLRLIFLSMIMCLNYFQMAHLSYFGTQVLPAGIYLLFTQIHEIHGTLKEEMHHLFIPLLYTLLPITLGWMAHKKVKLLYGWRGVEILVCLYLLYNPIRTYVTGNTWGRQPSTRELTGINLYLSLSYFLGRILPHKMTQEAHAAQAAQKNFSLKLKITPNGSSKWDKIVIILGESLSPNHMQLYGYDRPTTPFLQELKNRPNFFHTIGISGGVSTDIAVAFFMNMGYGSAGVVKASKGDQCLFRLARNNNFKNHFLSIQSDQQLRYISPYICSSSLDDFRSLEHISPGTIDHQAARDRDLLLPFKELFQINEKKFVVLHQRGSHAPWNLRYTKDSKIFTNSGDSRIDDYDNSVFEFDLFWKELYTILTESNQKTLLIYLSDHGEALGEGGRWGHGFIGSSSFEVPIMIMSFNQDLPITTKKIQKYFTHYNLGLLISEELGHKLNQQIYSLPDDYEVYGNDIDGFAGKAAIQFNDNDYSIKHLP